MLKCVDVLCQELFDTSVCAKGFTRIKCDALGSSPILDSLVVRDNQSRDEFTLVCDYHYLLEVAINGEFAFYSLRGYIFSVTRLEEIFYALCDV